MFLKKTLYNLEVFDLLFEPYYEWKSTFLDIFGMVADLLRRNSQPLVSRMMISMEAAAKFLGTSAKPLCYI